MSGFAYLLFRNSSLALRAEKILRRAGIPARLAPAPRQLSASCSLALRCDLDSLERARARLTAAGVDIAGFHPDRT
ncbi:MAG: DUF3343 domain-containing protein [candidate division NC10 bacterium]|nr:DUF3343 domain-containing protein [candidate division NC10 bacterium]